MEPIELLSFDPAISSLAVSHIILNLNNIILMKKVLKEKISFMEKIKKLNNLIDNVIIIKSLGVYNIADDAAVDSLSKIDRARLLYDFISKNFIPENHLKTKIIIEDQILRMGAKINTVSSAVCVQLAYAYAKSDIFIVNPKLKNKINLTTNNNELLDYQYFVEKYKTKYTANKAHCKANFIKFTKTFNINIKHIEKQRLSDLADSFLQIFTFGFNNYL